MADRQNDGEEMLPFTVKVPRRLNEEMDRVAKRTTISKAALIRTAMEAGWEAIFRDGKLTVPVDDEPSPSTAIGDLAARSLRYPESDFSGPVAEPGGRPAPAERKAARTAKKK